MKGSATGTYLTHANPGMQLLAVILVDAITQLLHVGSVRQLHHVGAHEPLQTSANARQIETVCVGGGGQVNETLLAINNKNHPPNER